MNEIERRRLGDKCRSHRMKKRWTQQELAEQIDKAVNTVSNIENGTTNVSTDTLIKLADAFEISLDDLVPRNQIGIDTYEPQKNKIIGLLLDSFQELNLEDLEMLLAFSVRLKR